MWRTTSALLNSSERSAARITPSKDNSLWNLMGPAQVGDKEEAARLHSLHPILSVVALIRSSIERIMSVTDGKVHAVATVDSSQRLAVAY